MFYQQNAGKKSQHKHNKSFVNVAHLKYLAMTIKITFPRKLRAD
jgi:hypothetical protein